MIRLLRQRCAALAILLGLVITGQGQLLLTPQLSPTGLLKKDQLWNMVVVNNNEETQSVQLQVSMVGIKSGVKVLSGSSRVFTLTKGVRQLQVADLGPIQYYYGSAELTDHDPNGLLALGEYQVCYTLFEQSEKSMLPVTDQCITVDIAPLSPPQLNTPQKGDTVLNQYPQFQWIPPAPMNMFTDLNYELLVVEVNKKQSAQEAMQKNTPIFHQYALKNMFLAYPSSAMALEAGKTYAWQVIARNGNNYAEKTDSWDFVIADGPVLQGIKASGFPRLQQGVNAMYYIFEDQLRFAYTEMYGDTTAIVSFFKGSTKGEPIFRKVVQIKPGENLLSENLLKKLIFREKELYRFEIIDSRGGKWSMLFKYQQPKQ